MKIIFSTIVIVAILTMFGCSKKENVSTPIENPVQNSEAYLVEGKIVAEFVDTLSQAHAECFLLAHDLTVYTLYNFDEAPPHSGIIEVPIGQEEAWVDTLQKYSEIKFAGRIGVVHMPISTPPPKKLS